MQTGLHEAVRRWHRLAGLIVLPFIAWLSVTGSAYLFHDAIDDAFHGGLRLVTPPANDTPTGSLSPATLVRHALQAHPGATAVWRYTPAARADRTVEVGLTSDSGERLIVYVDPYTGRVAGSLPENGTVAGTIRRLHSLKILGPVPRGVIELAAQWAIVLVIGGSWMAWPRGASALQAWRRAPRRSRARALNLHAICGLTVGGVLAFMAFSGLAWSVVWGTQFNRWINGSNFGYPSGVRVQVPMSGARLSDAGPTAWSLAQARMPESGGPDGRARHSARSGNGEQSDHAEHAVPPDDAAQPEHAGHGDGANRPDPAATRQGRSHPMAAAASGQGEAVTEPIGLDAAVVIVERLGIAPGYALQLPGGRRGVYTASVYPADLSRQRVIHLDQYTGHVLLDMSHADYGPLGRWAEWGINVHLGQQFGAANRWGLLASCAVVLILCVAALTAWWRRRARPSTPAPCTAGAVPDSAAPPDRTNRALLMAALTASLVFPLVGLSIVAIVIVQRLSARLSVRRGTSRSTDSS